MVKDIIARVCGYQIRKVGIDSHFLIFLIERRRDPVKSSGGDTSPSKPSNRVESLMPIYCSFSSRYIGPKIKPDIFHGFITVTKVRWRSTMVVQLICQSNLYGIDR